MAARDGKRLGLMLVDLDHFKKINDDCGHLAGDEALVKVGEALRAQIKRPLDAAGRYGGDEFIAVWFDVEADWFARLPEQFRSALGALSVRGEGRKAKSRQVTTSIGGVIVAPSSGSEPKQAIQQADELLYQVKQAGRNGFRVLELTLSEPATASD